MSARLIVAVLTATPDTSRHQEHCSPSVASAWLTSRSGSAAINASVFTATGPGTGRRARLPVSRFNRSHRVIVGTETANIADNLTAHHSPAVRAAIEARGARFLPLPAYSPDFNPIEEAFSKVKQFLRRAAARTDDDLRAATWAAFATITKADATGWFTHCGYPPADQAS